MNFNVYVNMLQFIQGLISYDFLQFWFGNCKNELDAFVKEIVEALYSCD